MIIYSRECLIILFFLLLLLFLQVPNVFALEVGTILYRTSSKGKMYGYSSKELVKEEHGVISHIYPGHAAIYIGQENGIDYVVEALSTGIVKTPAKYFINESLKEELVAARIPKQASSWQRAKAVAIAKYLASADLAYDFDFSDQKGPGSGDWTCVGLTEKVYESADAYNPERISALEYNPRYYAVDITPDGFDSQSIYNEKKDVFSKELEFSKISRRNTTILPLPEIIGYSAGKEYQGNRYIFLPYTQAIQASLRSVAVDIEISSSFKDQAVRGKVNNLGLILKWSLINNPVSSVKKIASSIGAIFKDNKTEALIRLSDNNESNYQNDYRDSVLDEQLEVDDNPRTKVIEKIIQPEIKAPSVANQPIGTKIAKIPARAEIVENKNSLDEKNSPESDEVIIKKDKLDSSKQTGQEEIKTSLSLWSPIAEPIIKQEKKESEELKKEDEDKPDKPNQDSRPPTNKDDDNEKKNEAEESPELNEDPLTLVISRIYAEGKDDWLEIWNYGDKDINLKERKIRIEKTKTASDPGIILRFDADTDLIVKGSYVIRAGEAYKIMRDDASPELLNQAQAIAVRPDFTFTNNGYTLYLAKGTVSSFDDEDIIDFVGYGDALYFEGRAPAPTLEPGFLLRRKAAANTKLEDILNDGMQANWAPIYDSDDNLFDFLLWPLGGGLILEDDVVKKDDDDDDDKINTDPVNNDQASNTAFTLNAGLDSEALFRLWSFSECQGDTSPDMISMNELNNLETPGFWQIGRWGCGQRLPSGVEGQFKANLNPILNGQTFTVLFNYQAHTGDGNLAFSLSNATANESLSVNLFPNMVEFAGFPNISGRIAATVGMEVDKWQQVALAWNTLEGYWALYIDGTELFRDEFTGDAPGFDTLTMKAISGQIVVDDIALWQRALANNELSFIAKSNEPFNPQLSLDPPSTLVLKHEFNFNETSGSTTTDKVSDLEWVLPPETLAYNGLTGRAYKAPASSESYFYNISPLTKNNFSLSWWYRNDNELDTTSGRFHLAVFSGEDSLGEFSMDSSQLTLNTTNWDDILSDGSPHDNNWHHLAMIYNDYKYSWQFYIDGVLKNETTRLPILKGMTIDTLRFRSSTYGYRLDNFKIWQGALNTADVLAQFEAEKI